VVTNSKTSTLFELQYIRNTNEIKKKGKSVPLQAWTGPEGSRKLRFCDKGTGWW